MTRRPDDDVTPFEETLTNLPQEPAPADLQDRCLAALDAAQVAKPARTAIPWNYFGMAAAASLLILIVASPLLLGMFAPAKSANEVMLAPPAPAPGPTAAPAGPGAPDGPGAGGPPAMPTPAGPVASKSMKQARVPTTAPPPPGAAPAMPAPTGSAKSHFGFPAAPPNLGSDQERRIREMQPKLPPQPPVTRDEAETPPVEPPSAPWYDRSDTHKKIVHRDMTLESPDVEDTYKRTISAVETAGGTVVHEDLTLERHKPGHATIEARVPVAAFESVLAQLRGLGKVVKLVGTSEDRTQEYKTQGQDIRTASDNEQDLVKQYESASDPQHKRDLKAQIDELRRTRGDQKQGLKGLAAETSFACLNLEITESNRFWHATKEKAADALPVAMALALVALPFFIVLLVWRRRS